MTSKEDDAEVVREICRDLVIRQGIEYMTIKGLKRDCLKHGVNVNGMGIIRALKDDSEIGIFRKENGDISGVGLKSGALGNNTRRRG